MALTPVPVALKALLDSVPAATSAETLPLAQCAGRVLATDVTALRTQPPFANSAMDGYAVRAGDLVPGQELRVIGESAAGRSFAGAVGPGEAVRIFTGAPIPEGADTILIQENADGVGSATIRVREGAPKGKFVRSAGLDFTTGDVLLPAGRRLDSAALGLAAAAGHPALPVRRKPLVAILATGDELVSPGEPVGPDQIVASNSFSLAALVEQAGATALDLGIARDNHPDLAARIERARAAGADVLITLGGASVGADAGRHGARLLEDRDAPGQADDDGAARRDGRRRPAGQPRLVDRLRPSLRRAADRGAARHARAGARPQRARHSRSRHAGQ
jgi:molybdopterin molybdotransferase